MIEQMKTRFLEWQLFVLKAALTLGLLFLVVGLIVPRIFDLVEFPPRIAVILAIQGMFGILAVGTVLNFAFTVLNMAVSRKKSGDS